MDKYRKCVPLNTNSLLLSCILVNLCLLFTACKSNSLDIGKSNQVQWRVTELVFTSSFIYSGNFDDVNLDAVFTHSSGVQLKVPAFWEGGKIWKIRFAPTLIGSWKYTTICSDAENLGLQSKTGELNCTAYEGKLDLYKHGFVKTMPNTRYFMYDDGTPFFYLGDTHWNIPANTLDNFKTIVNKRIEQGFTVIQSQPLEAKYNLKDGITKADSAGFADLDSRFQYVADQGLMHANAQFFFVTTLAINRLSYTDAYLEKLSRYWVARYSAYPVMWTTAQECDDGNAKNLNLNFDTNTNPWKIVFNNIHKYDPYQHPQTAHMEYVSLTSPSTSGFKNLPGHSWFAIQYQPQLDGQLGFDIVKSAWNNSQGKPALLYESSYDHLWTNEYGARNQGWTAYLNGMYGYGYGAADIWLFNSTYQMDQPTVKFGITISIADKQTKWNISKNFAAADQMGYMHIFFNAIEWWKLTPRFDDSAWFVRDGSWCSLASNNNDLYVAYFYNTINQKTGTIKGLSNTTYSKQWFNPITNEYSTPTIVSITNGTHIIGNKPDNKDWVLLFQKK